MFVKDGPKTPEEERIAHMPPAPHDPEAVKAAQHAIDEQILHAGETPDDLGSIHNEQPVAEPSATLVAKDAKEEKKSWLDSHPVEELRKHVHPSKDKDELLDIHVGNPLRRITELLEDIKKQKAFSFTLRGSLGIMGVALAFSTFGIFGGSKLLCDKGTQSYIGTVKQLTYTEEGDYPFLTKLSDAYSILIGGRPSEKPTTRLILIQQDNQAINLTISRTLDRGGPPPNWITTTLASALGKPIIATGPYDACSRTLKINQQTAIEIK